MSSPYIISFIFVPYSFENKLRKINRKKEVCLVSVLFFSLLSLKSKNKTVNEK